MNTVNYMTTLRYSRFIVILLSAVFFSMMLTGALHPVFANCPSDMLSYWKLEEAGGGSYDDHNGSNDAQCAGTCPAYTSSGMINAGQIFNGNNTGLTVPADSSFDWGADDNFSIEYWMKRSSAGFSGDEVVVGRRDSSGDLLWWSGLLSDGRAFFILTATNGDGRESSYFLYGSRSLADGLWHHIVSIRDADNNKNVLFVDGEEQASVSIQYSAGFESSTANLNIGWLNLDSGYHFNGVLDEVAIHNTVLSEIEISQHYNDGLVGLRLGYCEGGYPAKIMPLGDSLTYGYLPGEPSWTQTTGYRQKLYLDLFNLNFNIDFVGSLASGGAASPTFDTDHEGHSAWTDYDIVNGNPDYPEYGKLDDWLSVYNPEVILLHIGTNELDTSPDDVEDILNEIDLYNEDITVVLARIINRATYSSDTTIFNDNVEDMANIRIANGDRIILVDQENALTYPDDMSDPLHPTAEGYDKMASVWLDGLLKILPVSSLNSAPVIFSIPKTVTLRNSQYIYDVNALGIPAPGYTLSSAPTGMTIDGSTGMIEWLHPSTGDYNITVMAANSEGADLQEFTITVLADFEQIIDNDSSYFVMNGDWYESTLIPGFYGDDFLYANGGSGEATGEWMFDIPSNGRYKISARWPSHASLSQNTRYTILHDNELTTVVMDQTIAENGNQWNELGAFYFPEGRASVFIDNNTTGYPVADAIRIKSVPKAGFIGTPTTGSLPLTISFSDSSTGIIHTWTWNFGDGGTSSDRNPTHEYTETGDYTVSLTVIGDDGTDTLTIENYIKVLPPPPVAGFSVDPTSGTELLTATFTDKSTGEIDTWSWDFGDGSTSNTQNPNHEYTVPGDYTVSLTVAGPGGTDTRTIEDYISVLPAPPDDPSDTPAGGDDGGGGGCFISLTGL